MGEIEQALQHQVIYGGDLATNLLELGLADENVLTEYMARSMGLPPADVDVVDQVDIEAIKSIPWSVANANDLLPVRFQGDRLLVAVSTPLNDETCQGIAFLLGVEFTQCFVLGFRLAMARNRYYGIPIPARFSSLQARLAPNFEPDLPPLVGPTPVNEALVSPDNSDVAPDPAAFPEESESTETGIGSERDVSHSQSVRETDTTLRIFVPEKSKKATDVKFLEVPRRFSDDPAPVQEAEPAVEEQAVSGAEAPAATMSAQEAVSKVFAKRMSEGAEETFESTFNPDEAISTMQEAEDRDAVIELIMEHGARAFEFVVLMVVHGNVAQGRSAVLNHHRSDKVDHVSIPLDQGGMFETVFATRSCHLGPLGTSEIEQQALKNLGRSWPKNCAILPVTLRGRVVSIIYGDSGDRGVNAGLITDFTRFTQAVADAFERILLERKAQKSKLDDSRPTKPAPSPLESEETQEPEPKQEPEPRQESKSPGDGSAGFYLVTPEASGDTPMTEVVPGASKRRPSRPPEPAEETLLERSGSPSAHRKVVDVEAVQNAPNTERETLDQRLPSRPPAASRPSPGAYSAVSDESNYQFGSADSVTTDEPLGRGTEADGIDAGGPANWEPIVKGAVVSVNESNRSAANQPSAKSEPPEPAEPAQTESVTQDVIASRVVNVNRTTNPRSVVVEMNEEIDRLVQRILTPGRYDETAAQLLVGMGDDALKALVQLFPGPLLCDRYQQVGRLQRVARHGPLLMTLLKFKKKAVPRLTQLFSSADSDVRFYAVFMFSELIYPEAVSVLADRLFDSDRQIRALTIDIIRAFEKYPEYEWAMREVVSVLNKSDSGVESKLIAAEAIGQLRVVSAVETLIAMLDSVDTNLVERCHRALVRIAFEDFGFSAPKWSVWFEKNGMRHRAEWAIDSILHRKEAIRNAAISEIPQIVGDVVEWSNGPMDHKRRMDLQSRLRDWWMREGRALFPNQGSD